MRFREDTTAEHNRARAVVAEWREAHPGGTVDQLVADLGGQFRKEYVVVLRGVFYAQADRASTLQLADDTEDCVVRRQRFEAARPDVPITTPPTLRDSWCAVVPAGQTADGNDLTMTVKAWSLCELMDKLDDIYPPEGGQG